MKLTVITLTLIFIALCAYIKASYKYASVQDEVDAPPIDYEDTKAYKDNEIWFSGIR